MTPEELVAAALKAAEEGMAAGELPIGAVVATGEALFGRAFTQERASGRRLVHAELLAMVEADEQLGRADRPEPLRLAVNLEPCLMCLGAAMVLGVREVYFGLESPGDGGAGVATSWQTHPDAPWFRAPRVVGGIFRERARDQFRRYARAAAPGSGLGRWAQTLADRPD